jgi:hypothetical protein
VQQERLPDGRRIVSAVAEVEGGGDGSVEQIYCCDGVAERWLVTGSGKQRDPTA